MWQSFVWFPFQKSSIKGEVILCLNQMVLFICTIQTNSMLWEEREKCLKSIAYSVNKWVQK